jgi:L-cysteate sulfo-lyase
MGVDYNKMRLSVLPRIRLANLPTPLEEAKKLSRKLDGPKILVKRDDLTGLAFGGNKTRKLEFLMAEALNKGADVIVTGAGFQSNWCTQAAAAACKLGLDCVLIKRGPIDDYDPEKYDGNHLIHFLLGAKIKVAESGNLRKVYEETIKELRDDGRQPYLLTAAGSTPPGVMGYVNALIELVYQSMNSGRKIDYLVHASGSGGTMAGLILGTKIVNLGIKIIGAAVSPGKDYMAKVVSDLVIKSSRFIDSDINISPNEIEIFDDCAGEGYGVLTEKKAEAVKLAAETEGLLLDPVYTGTSMATLIDLIRNGYFKQDETVVFLHTGGSAALFPYKEPLKAYGRKKVMPWKVPPWANKE